MLGAALIVHLSGGVFVANNGWELVRAIGAGAWPSSPPVPAAGRSTASCPVAAAQRESVSVR